MAIEAANYKAAENPDELRARRPSPVRQVCVCQVRQWMTTFESYELRAMIERYYERYYERDGKGKKKKRKLFVQ